MQCKNLQYAKKNEKKFSYEGLLHSVRHDHLLAQAEVESFRTEIENFLNLGPSSPRSRNRRGAAPVLLGAAAVSGVFGLGPALGDDIKCLFRGIFGFCQDRTKQNSELIKHTIDHLNAFQEEVLRVQTATNEKFLVLVTSELKNLQNQQRRLAKAQNANMKEVERQFQVMNDNFGYLRNCNAFLYGRDESLNNSNLLMGILTNIYGHIRSYRSAFYTFRINLLNSVPIMFHRSLLPSLVSKGQLKSILANLNDQQDDQGNRLSLDIPLTEIMA